jgi:hypothetical protein
MKTSLPLFVATSLIRIVASVIAIALTATVGAAVYKVTDDQGRVTYTDTPPTETTQEAVQFPPVNKVPTLTPGPVTAQGSEDAELLPMFNGYSFAALIAPINDSLVQFDQPKLLAQLALTPELNADHLVQFYVDGSPYGQPVAASSQSIAGLERGTHHISARVLSSQGAVLVIAKPVTVHVQRHFKRK